MIFYPVSPWILFVVLLIIAIYFGLKSKWGPLVLLVVIFFVYKSCEQYEEDWGENGRYAKKTEKELDYEMYGIDFSTIPLDDGYYPMENIDMMRPDCYPPAPRTNTIWKVGYKAGAEAGTMDCLAGTPYASYELVGHYQRQKGATFRYGYWVGYSNNYPGLKRLTDAEVLDMYKKSKYYNPK